MDTIAVRTSQRSQFIEITRQVQDSISKSGIKDGLVCVFAPHTTAGITINENADPDVASDMIDILTQVVPERAGYRHREGNSDGHAKSSLISPSITVIVENGRLCLGTWQGIYFAEFDGPRQRQCWIKIIASEP
ncbi:MAG: YjbQ family protein [Armatimonadetes bacterium]|nr:YjbQ family protein [Armatimonadota bacterium]